MFGFIKKGKIEYIVAGLGNPGSKYAKTRHNAGFMALDRLAREEGFEFKKMKFRALIADEMINGTRCLIMKPQTMMNLSGEAIIQAADYYNIPDENIIVIFDDVSLDVGKTRVRRKGSAGGHNGIKSIISCLGSENFPRIKIGVGKKPAGESDMVEWVLGEFPKSESENLDKALDNTLGALKLLVKGETDKAMNEYNS
ncbi:MAG: aminoacyl-tRNA hydrolase [Eubacterium sp.]|nr:aminoacyl-tRNA hydrolase [Eubacterium sp.]